MDWDPFQSENFRKWEEELRLGHGCNMQVTVKNTRNKYFANGDKEMNRSFLNLDNMKTRCEAIQSWFPDPSIVRCENLENVLENSQEVKKEAARLMKIFLSNKQAIGVGECLLVHVHVKVKSLDWKIREALS